ncbi:MAG: nucleoside hydrolase [Eggerthellaceae bacterium]|nr:nucleoside hydrolase [Eggerthellaceae bacterium]
MDKRIIVDFDNTMGVEGKDTDDGLALLYLLGFEDARIEAICTTYGNSTIDVVHENTRTMLGEMGLDIPLYKGAPAASDEPSDAARFLARAAADNPGQLHLVATGSLTNLRGAQAIDPNFYSNLAGVFIMGGYTESLPFRGFFIDELNTSCDPDATYGLIEASNVGAPGKPGCPVSVATAQICLPAVFSRADFDAQFGADSWVVRACSSWFRNMEEHLNWPHAVCWDVVAAAMLMQPELFDVATMDVTLYRRYFSVGYFEQAGPDAPSSTVNVPTVADPQRFVAEVFAAWHRGLARLGME